MPTETLRVDEAHSTPWRGDASVTSEVAATFTSNALNGRVGRISAKACQFEFNLFFKYDLSGVHLGARWDAMNFEWTTSGSSQDVGGTGKFRFGILFPRDGIFDIAGNSFTFGGPAGTQYTESARFPSLSPVTAPPHATKNSSSAVEPARIFFDVFTGGTHAWGVIAGETRITLGSGIGSETFLDADLTIGIATWRNAFNETKLAFTLDSQNVSCGANHLTVYLDRIDDARVPNMVIEYTENPPTIDSTSPTDGEEQHLFTYTPASTTWSLGDQTSGQFLVQAWTITGEPSGMVINPTTGVVTWTPTIGQRGVFTFTIRLTNPGLLFAEETITLTIGPVGRGTKLIAVTSGPVVVARAVAAPAVDAGAIIEVAIRARASSEIAVVTIGQSATPPTPAVITAGAGVGAEVASAISTAIGDGVGHPDVSDAIRSRGLLIVPTVGDVLLAEVLATAQPAVSYQGTELVAEAAVTSQGAEVQSAVAATANIEG